MKKEIYTASQPNIVHAEYDSDLATIIATWYTLIAPQDTEPCYRALAKAMQNEKPYSMIMNTSEAKNTIRKDDLEWIDNYFFPRAVHYGTRDFIVISPISALSKDAMQNYIHVAEKAGIAIHMAEDLSDAQNIAASIRDQG